MVAHCMSVCNECKQISGDSRNGLEPHQRDHPVRNPNLFRPRAPDIPKAVIETIGTVRSSLQKRLSSQAQCEYYSSEEEVGMYLAAQLHLVFFNVDLALAAFALLIGFRAPQRRALIFFWLQVAEPFPYSRPTHDRRCDRQLIFPLHCRRWPAHRHNSSWLPKAPSAP